jgi:hypothetical protein
VIFVAITVFVAAQRVFIVVISLLTQFGNFWIHPRISSHSLTDGSSDGVISCLKFRWRVRAVVLRACSAATQRIKMSYPSVLSSFMILNSESVFCIFCFVCGDFRLKFFRYLSLNRLHYSSCFVMAYTALVSGCECLQMLSLRLMLFRGEQTVNILVVSQNCKHPPSHYSQIHSHLDCEIMTPLPVFQFFFFILRSCEHDL